MQAKSIFYFIIIVIIININIILTTLFLLWNMCSV